MNSQENKPNQIQKQRGGRPFKFTNEQLIECLKSGLFCTQNEIAQYLGAARCTITNRIKKLIEEGKITKDQIVWKED